MAGQSNSPPALYLRDLRRSRQLTQAELARRLHKAQEEVSRMEQRADLRLSTLRAYVEALGGELELRCRFQDQGPVRVLTPERDASGQRPRPAAELLIERHRAELEALCRRYEVRRLALFGSALRSDFDPVRSDLDFTAELGRSPALSPAHQYFDLKAALERLFGRAVDLVELRAMPETRLKRLIEATQVPVYAETEAA